MRRSRKPVYPQGYRGFESPPLRIQILFRSRAVRGRRGAGLDHPGEERGAWGDLGRQNGRVAVFGARDVLKSPRRVLGGLGGRDAARGLHQRRGVVGLEVWVEQRAEGRREGGGGDVA